MLKGLRAVRAEGVLFSKHLPVILLFSPRLGISNIVLCSLQQARSILRLSDSQRVDLGTAASHYLHVVRDAHSGGPQTKQIRTSEVRPSKLGFKFKNC